MMDCMILFTVGAAIGLAFLEGRRHGINLAMAETRRSEVDGCTAHRIEIERLIIKHDEELAAMEDECEARIATWDKVQTELATARSELMATRTELASALVDVSSMSAEVASLSSDKIGLQSSVKMLSEQLSKTGTVLANLLTVLNRDGGCAIGPSAAHVAAFHISTGCLQGVSNPAIANQDVVEVVRARMRYLTDMIVRMRGRIDQQKNTLSSIKEQAENWCDKDDL